MSENHTWGFSANWRNSAFFYFISHLFEKISTFMSFQWVFKFFRLYHTVMNYVINHSQWTILLHLIAKKFWKTSILAHFHSFLPCLRPYRPLKGCPICIILFYLFRFYHIVMSSNINNSQWTILMHLIAKMFRKTSILAHFCSFLPCLLPSRPLIRYQIWIIMFYLFILYHIVMSSIIHYELLRV